MADPGYLRRKHRRQEGTSDGVISGNAFSNVGISTAFAWVDSWVDIKRNNDTVTNNVGVSARRQGFEVNEEVDGRGGGNAF